MNNIFSGILNRLSGFTVQYDLYRPVLPAVIADILCLLAQVERLSLVLDEASRTLMHGRAFLAFGYTIGRQRHRVGKQIRLFKPESGFTASWKTHQIDNALQHWNIQHNLAMLTIRSCFCFIKEIVIQNMETSNVTRMLGLLLSQGGVMDFLKLGLS